MRQLLLDSPDYFILSIQKGLFFREVAVKQIDGFGVFFHQRQNFPEKSQGKGHIDRINDKLGDLFGERWRSTSEELEQDGSDDVGESLRFLNGDIKVLIDQGVLLFEHLLFVRMVRVYNKHKPDKISLLKLNINLAKYPICTTSVFYPILLKRLIVYS